jgi:hypothetical protein
VTAGVVAGDEAASEGATGGIAIVPLATCNAVPLYLVVDSFF